MCTKPISQVKEVATSERVKNVVKTTLKVAAVVGGVIIVYKFGKSMSKTEEKLKLQDALGLVEEIKNCSLPWDDAHWEALSIIVEYVKRKLQ